MTRTLLSACLLATAALAACSQAADPTPGLIGRTIVTLNAHGEATAKTDLITVDQQRAEMAAHAAATSATRNGIGSHQQALSQDPSCAGSSLWIFDNYNNTIGTFPNNHEICFFRNGASGCADLTSYIRYCSTNLGHFSCSEWGVPQHFFGPIHSYYPGGDAGYFIGALNDGGTFNDTQNFAPWVRVDDSDSQFAVETARYVCFD
jgi:hypothetical protein